MKLQFEEFKKYGKTHHVKHMLPFKEIIADGNQQCILYNYCNGHSLHDTLKKRGQAFEEEKVKEILKHVTKFFFESERHGGCLHHDLKLENIYVHRDQYYVGGLDLAEWGQHSSTRICGSGISSAPEIHQAVHEAAWN